MNNYLLMVEGSKTEPTIFHKVLLKYGYNVIKVQEKLNIEDFNGLNSYSFKKDMNNVVIIQGPRNRIHDFLSYYDKNVDSFEKMLSMHMTLFQGIFLIYDVDHNDNLDILEMFNKFNDESSGMLLLSSPCFEVIGDYNHNRVEEKYKHISEYKKELNIYYSNNKTSINEYIINNFETLCIYYLEKNHLEFNENNIMEHPRLVIDLINKNNERVNYSYDDKEKSYTIYRYFTTVVYVFIAYINKLTVKIDNYETVKKWFSSQVLYKIANDN